MSTTGRSVLSGYWMVIGSRKRCENVTAIPSRMVLAAFDTLAMYSAKFIRKCSSVDVHPLAMETSRLARRLLPWGTPSVQARTTGPPRRFVYVRRRCAPRLAVFPRGLGPGRSCYSARASAPAGRSAPSPPRRLIALMVAADPRVARRASDTVSSRPTSSGRLGASRARRSSRCRPGRGTVARGRARRRARPRDRPERRDRHRRRLCRRGPGRRSIFVPSSRSRKPVDRGQARSLSTSREDDADTTAWAVGAQLGPKLPVADDAHGVGYEALLLAGHTWGENHFVLNLGGLVDPGLQVSRSARKASKAGSTLDVDLRTFALLGDGRARRRALLLGRSRPVERTAGLTFAASATSIFSVDRSRRLPEGGDRGGVLLGVSPKFALWK